MPHDESPEILAATGGKVYGKPKNYVNHAKVKSFSTNYIVTRFSVVYFCSGFFLKKNKSATVFVHVQLELLCIIETQFCMGYRDHPVWCSSTGISIYRAYQFC